MKKIYRKQIIFVIVAVLVVLAGVIAFFIVSKTQKNKYVEITLPCAMSDGHFTLAKLPKDYFNTIQIPDENKEQFELYCLMTPKDEVEFLNETVTENRHFVKEYISDAPSMPDGKYHRYLYFYENEYFMMEKNGDGDYQLLRLYLMDNLAIEDSFIYFWIGEDLIKDNKEVKRSWEESKKPSYAGIIINDFSDLCEFYERLDSNLCKIDYDNQTILVKGIQEATKTVSNDYLLKITADEEGFKAEKVF